MLYEYVHVILQDYLICNVTFNIYNLIMDESAKVILNFTQNCVSNTKVLRGAKIVPTWGPSTNIVFSLEGN